jgi:hypothetical protein
MDFCKTVLATVARITIRVVAELPDHLGIADFEVVVAAQQQHFCFCTETAHFYLHQPGRALSFTYRGWGHFHK